MEQTFKAQSFRRIPNPYAVQDDGDTSAAMYVAICDVKDLPNNFPMETNPREQNLNSKVAKRIKESLINPDSANFHLLNRGLLLSAKKVSFNNYNQELTVEFADFEVHGDVDGGHTYRVILENRDLFEHGKQFVKVEILTGIEAYFQDLAAARNTSTQVKDQSIAELEKRFVLIKEILEEQSYLSRISFKENDEGEIEVGEVVAILNMFNIERYPVKDPKSFPTVSYNSNKTCIDYYIIAHKNFEDSRLNPYCKMNKIMKDIFKLYDQLEVNIGEYYKRKNPGGKYGLVKGVIPKRNLTNFKSKYLEKPMDYQTAKGYLFPIIGAFRALLIEIDGHYEWEMDPFMLMEIIGPELVDMTIERGRSLGYNPNAVGRDIQHWKSVFQTVLIHKLMASNNN